MKRRKGDPAFLFYPGDWLRDTQLMSRCCRGAYIDLLVLQFCVGRMSQREIRDYLGRDYSRFWFGRLKNYFVEDSNGLYYNELLEDTINRRKKYKEGRLNNLKRVNNVPYGQSICTTVSENEIENAISIKNKGVENRVENRVENNRHGNNSSGQYAGMVIKYNGADYKLGKNELGYSLDQLKKNPWLSYDKQVDESNMER